MKLYQLQKYSADGKVEKKEKKMFILIFISPLFYT